MAAAYQPKLVGKLNEAAREWSRVSALQARGSASLIPLHKAADQLVQYSNVMHEWTAAVCCDTAMPSKANSGIRHNGLNKNKNPCSHDIVRTDGKNAMLPCCIEKDNQLESKGA